MPTLAQLDPILVAWSRERGISLVSTYKDEEVRSFDVGGPADRRCQIWIEAPKWRRSVTVSVWDYASRRRDFKADVSSLEARLDEALATARSWL